MWYSIISSKSCSKLWSFILTVEDEVYSFSRNLYDAIWLVSCQSLFFFSSTVISLINWGQSWFLYSIIILVFVKNLKFVFWIFCVCDGIMIELKYMLARYVCSLNYVVCKIWWNIFCWILAVLIDLSLL
jgi:hypothetical protein